MDKINSVDVYLLLDIVFTPLFDENTTSIMNMSVSKPIWVETSLLVEGNQLIFPTFVLSVVCPFVITKEGKILKCRYNPALEGISFFGYELALLEGMCIRTKNQEWDWESLTSKHHSYASLKSVYGSMDEFRRTIDQYPYDNSLLKSILEEAELEL